MHSYYILYRHTFTGSLYFNEIIVNIYIVFVRCCHLYSNMQVRYLT